MFRPEDLAVQIRSASMTSAPSGDEPIVLQMIICKQFRLHDGVSERKWDRRLTETRRRVNRRQGSLSYRDRRDDFICPPHSRSKYRQLTCVSCGARSEEGPSSSSNASVQGTSATTLYVRITVFLRLCGMPGHSSVILWMLHGVREAVKLD